MASAKLCERIGEWIQDVDAVARLANTLQAAEKLAAVGLRQRQRHARRETDGGADLTRRGDESVR